jgi:FAD/FMN-containing dehydrogenase
MVNGARVRALRYAREVVDDLRWRGMTVPPLYATMAEEFHALVRSGAYAAWVTAAQKATSPRGLPGSTWERLAAVKGRYDPANLFRRNHNLPPAAIQDTQRP